jgi:hypothetical protein
MSPIRYVGRTNSKKVRSRRILAFIMSISVTIICARPSPFLTLPNHAHLAGSDLLHPGTAEKSRHDKRMRPDDLA